MSEHNLTFPRAPSHTTLTVSPMPSARCAWSLYGQQ